MSALLLLLSYAVTQHFVTQAAALQCGIDSDGSDQAIVDCYTARGLPVPSDV